VSASRKLIEVALPLDAINAACKADKDRKTGTIRNLHKWFAPMPLPAWRALLFATLVDDPQDERDRDRLMRLIERLVEHGGDLPDSTVMKEARSEVDRSWPDGVPLVVDPFCGGGSTLVEAQRLGCRTAGSDLNPVPVLITRVLTELLPNVAGQPSVSVVSETLDMLDRVYEGIGADVLHYGEVVRESATQRLREHFSEAAGATTIAWLWCRTVKCPNPACGKTAPLIDSTVISRTAASEYHVAVRYPDGSTEPHFAVVAGASPAVPGTVDRVGGSCLACHSPIPFSHIRQAGSDGKLGLRMMAKVQTYDGRRRFVGVSELEESQALNVPPIDDPPTVPINPGGAGIRVPPYGIGRVVELFTPRQQLVLSVFADEVARLDSVLIRDGASNDRRDAVVAMLGLCVGKLAQACSSLVRWNVRHDATAKAEPAFGRHDMAMTWDFAETNPFGGSVGDWSQIVRTALRSVKYAAEGVGTATQSDARTALRELHGQALVATDPPYFDQIGYADLSDYFYVWLRRALRTTFPDLFATVATPKREELIALPSRHEDDKVSARHFFVDGFTEVFHEARAVQPADAPLLIVYAFKEKGGVAGDDIAPGWEAILDAVIEAELTVVGTWPIRGTGSSRMRATGSNALATYVVLVCRPRPSEAQRITRSEFTRLLKREMASAVVELQHANIAPVDLAQAVIGPAMQVYSRHSEIVETDGSRVQVAQALRLINRTLDEILDEQEGDLDSDSRWAVTWYEAHAFDPYAFGEADQLARAKGIAVDSLVQAGIITSGANKVALIPRDALPAGWDPQTDPHPTAWEGVQHLVRGLLDEGGEVEAARQYARLGALTDPSRELAYRLFQIADKNGRKEESIAYNALVTSWSEIARLAESLPSESTRVATTEALF